MKLIYHPDTPKHTCDAFVQQLQQEGCHLMLLRATSQHVVGVAAVPHAPPFAKHIWAKAETLGSVSALHPDYPLASKDLRSSTHVQVGAHRIGPETMTIMAGPCAIESAAQLDAIAAHVAASGAQFLRGGAFKARTSPYCFQGLGLAGLDLLSQTAKKYGLLSICEVVSADALPAYASRIDVLQVGARNMQNFALLKAIGQTQQPVMLKRGLSATYHEWLLAAEYILCHGNPNVILCERGIRTFEPMTRNTFDINALAMMATLTHLPVIADPSHGTGRRDLVGPVAKAAVAAGAMGVMLEVHTHPDQSVSDAAQALDCQHYRTLVPELVAMHDLTHRTQPQGDMAASHVAQDTLHTDANPI